MNRTVKSDLVVFGFFDPIHQSIKSPPQAEALRNVTILFICSFISPETLMAARAYRVGFTAILACFFGILFIFRYYTPDHRDGALSVAFVRPSVRPSVAYIYIYIYSE